MRQGRVLLVILALGIGAVTALAQQTPTIVPSAIDGLTPEAALSMANRWSRQTIAGLAVSLTSREL